jgi:hypothetical protein
MSGRPDRWSARIDQTLGQVRSHSIGHVRSRWRRFGTSLDSIGRCTSCVRSSSAVASGHAKSIAVTKNSVIYASGHCFAQRPVTAADACCCRATDRTRLVLIGPRPVTSAELVSSRSCISLGFYLRAWTLLDILGLLLCF